MMKTLWMLIALVAVNLCAADVPQEPALPAPVLEEIKNYLGTVTLSVLDLDPALALEWQLRLADVQLKIESTEKASAKQVSFKLVDVKLAEAMLTISKNTGVQYRIVGKSIRLAMPEEWNEIDAGKKRFEDLKKNVIPSKV